MLIIFWYPTQVESQKISTSNVDRIKQDNILHL